MIEKWSKLKIWHELVSGLNKFYDNIHGNTYGVCFEFVRKLTDLFFITINDIPSSICNVVSSDKKKLSRLYVPMYLDLDDYTPYRNALRQNSETKINFNLRCCHRCPNPPESYEKTNG